MDITTFFIVLLGVSVVGLSTLIAIKRFEIKTGCIFLGSLRPRLGKFSHRALLVLERSIPAFISRLVHRTVAGGKWLVHYGIAHGIVATEQSLERVLKTLRHTTHPSFAGTRKEVSAFLREVAEHKKQLLTRNSSQTAVPQVVLDR